MTDNLTSKYLDLVNDIDANLSQAHAMTTIMRDAESTGFNLYNGEIKAHYVWALEDKLEGVIDMFSALHKLNQATFDKAGALGAQDQSESLSIDDALSEA